MKSLRIPNLIADAALQASHDLMPLPQLINCRAHMKLP
jgi:hypothetical protein